MKIVETRGTEALSARNEDGNTAFQLGLLRTLSIDSCIYMMRQSIAAGIGGEKVLEDEFTMQSEDFQE